MFSERETGPHASEHVKNSELKEGYVNWNNEMSGKHSMSRQFALWYLGL
jgi:hypothetical protein